MADPRTGLEGLTSTATVYQSERRSILTDWRSIAFELADALLASGLGLVKPTPDFSDRGSAAMERYRAAVAHLKPEPLPMGPATHEVTVWTWAGDRVTEQATSEPRSFVRAGKARKNSGGRVSMVDADIRFYEWRRPEGGINECRADRLVSVVEIATKQERTTDFERCADSDIFEGLVGEHLTQPEGRPWVRTVAYLAERAKKLP